VRQGYVALLGGLMLLGLYAMLLGKSAKRLPPQYTLLGIAGVVVVALQAVLPSDTVNYGLARVLQQALTVLALPIAVMSVLLLSRFDVPFRRRFRLAAVGVVAMFLFISSLIPTLTGGFRPALAFSNAGFYYEAYYTHTAEIEADRWLVANTPKGSRVYADEFSRRRLITYANIFAEPTLVPAAIPKDSYVYISKGNLMYGHVPVYHKGQLIFYSLPLEFLNKHKNIVYNSGDVIIYK
jgi:uncharacterized membrane protein